MPTNEDCPQRHASLLGTLSSKIKSNQNVNLDGLSLRTTSRTTRLCRVDWPWRCASVPGSRMQLDESDDPFGSKPVRLSKRFLICPPIPDIAWRLRHAFTQPNLKAGH